MKACIVSDSELETGTGRRLREEVSGYLREHGFEVQHFPVGREDLDFCIGCFGCWVRTPGECVLRDRVGEINAAAMRSDAVVYLSPIIFGQFSANIKNAIDRWLPNMLPFFMLRKNGSMMHPRRYESYPAQVIIGYDGCDADPDAEDVQLFHDITRKHRANIETLVFDRTCSDIAGLLDRISLCRITGGTL